MIKNSTETSFWNERYQQEDYIYGDKPNDFLYENANILRKNSKILCLAEGEGRNAIYLAKQSHQVQAIDFSEQARKKAISLAQKHDIALEYHIEDLMTYNMGQQKWDAIISIFCHLHEQARPALYNAIKQALQPGGIILMEAYNKQQPTYGTGGPPQTTHLINLSELQYYFNNFEILIAQETVREVIEGKGHTGKGAVTQFIARKKVRILQRKIGRAANGGSESLITKHGYLGAPIGTWSSIRYPPHVTPIYKSPNMKQVRSLQPYSCTKRT